MTFFLPERNGSGNSKGKSATSTTVCLETFPLLVEFLSSTSTGEGGSRVPGTLQLTSSQGKWKAKLKEPNEKLYCFVTGLTLDDALEALNAGLGEANGLDWRDDTWESNGKKK
jgi:hypothetical protein